jgi:hypothetical protein
MALTCGVAGIASGAWQITDPQGFAQVERQVRARLDPAFNWVKGEG